MKILNPFARFSLYWELVGRIINTQREKDFVTCASLSTVGFLKLTQKRPLKLKSIKVDHYFPLVRNMYFSQPRRPSKQCHSLSICLDKSQLKWDEQTSLLSCDVDRLGSGNRRISFLSKASIGPCKSALKMCEQRNFRKNLDEEYTSGSARSM